MNGGGAMGRNRKASSLNNSIQYTSGNWIIGDPASYAFDQANKNNRTSSANGKNRNVNISGNDLDLLRRIFSQDKKKIRKRRKMPN